MTTGLIWEPSVVAPSREVAIARVLAGRPDLRIVACYQMQTPTCWWPREGQLDFTSWLVGVCCPRLRTWRVIARESEDVIGVLPGVPR